MHSKPQKRTAERLICRESWKSCLPAKTKARARMPPPFLQPSCVLRSRFDGHGESLSAELSYNPVAHSTVNDATNQICGVKFVCEVKLITTLRGDRFQLVVRQRKIVTLEVAFTLRSLARPDVLQVR